jgi:hypothetical protein
LESPVAVLHHYDAKVKHRIGLPRLRPGHTIADGHKHPSSWG